MEERFQKCLDRQMGIQRGGASSEPPEKEPSLLSRCFEGSVLKTQFCLDYIKSSNDFMKHMVFLVYIGWAPPIRGT